MDTVLQRPGGCPPPRTPVGVPIFAACFARLGLIKIRKKCKLFLCKFFKIHSCFGENQKIAARPSNC